MLDLHGRVVRVESHREWPLEGVVGVIAAYSPIVIACDTNPSHSLARQLGTAFGARLFFPRKSLSRHSKLLATRGESCRNPHERDALAAALKAFGHYQNKVRQTEKKARRAGVDAEGIVRRVLFGEKMAHALRR